MAGFNRLITGDEAAQDRKIYIPSVEACNAFGITRTTDDKVNKTNEDSIGFLTGSQFKTNIFANDVKSGNTGGLGIDGLSSVSSDDAKLEKNILDEIMLEFIGNSPTTVQQRVKNGLVLTSMDEKRPKDPYLVMNVAPNSTDWMSFSNDHDWESGGGVLQQILQTLGELGQAASDFGTLVENVGGAIEGNNNYEASKIVKTEFTSTYRGSSPVQFTIPFTLFTPGGQIQDFIRDIFYPIMLLNFLSYPRRLKILTPEQLEEQGLNPDGSNTKSTGNGDEGANIIDDTANTLQSIINQNKPGSRLAILEPPSYIRISHSSGLFKFPACAITSFSYNYKGPWINMNKDVVKMPEYSAFTSDSKFMKRGFPCIAECSLTFRSVDPLYADDWANMFNTSDLINLSNETSSEGAIKTSRRNQSQDEQDYQSQINNNPFGSGVRFASNVGVNIGFRGRL